MFQLYSLDIVGDYLLYLVLTKCIICPLPHKRGSVNTEFSKLASKFFQNVYLWANESYLRTFLVLFIFFVFGLPLVEYLQELVRTIPYYQIGQDIFKFFYNNFSLSDYIVSILFILTAVFLLKIYSEFQKMYVIFENFDDDLSRWSVPLNSVWTIQKCIDGLGKMLSVTNSFYPGILKETFSWYDYEIRFQVRLSKDTPVQLQLFSLVIRSENSLNGILLQITSNHFNPHLLYNGTYILDKNSFQQLPTILPVEEWIMVRVIVKGNNVDILFAGYRIQYKIPTKVLNVESGVLYSGVDLTELEERHKKIEVSKETISKYINEINAADESKKAGLISDLDAYLKEVPSFSSITLEYQKGSIGFRQSNQEHAYFRYLRVKKI